jgi:hypothetical protein
MASRFFVLAFTVAGLLCSAAAHAQLRSIPQEARRGELRHLQDMIVEIDGKPRRLAPGAQIRDTANRVVMPTAVAARTPVRYLVNGEGMVRQVWILSPEEAAKR